MAVDPSSRWAVLDTETSGLSPRGDRVLSLAVVTLDRHLNVEDTYYTLLNPGVDPGPVEIHGLTREVLAGAPRFEDVADTFVALTRGRVVVAHNAGFDMGFLQMEAALAGVALEHTAVVDSLRMARRVEPGMASYSLASLASRYGVRQQRAHDALDDTRVLVELFRALHDRAITGGVEILAMGERVRPERRASSTRSSAPNPGKWVVGSALAVGMRVAFTGGEPLLREALEERAASAGLHVSSSVSSKTSLLVEGRGAGTKASRAREVGCPVLGYADFVGLLAGLEGMSAAQELATGESGESTEPRTC